MVDLSGLVIVNTRPANRAQALTTELVATGATVAALPLLEIQPLALTAEQRQWLIDIDYYRWVFVVSPTAAELGLAHLGNYWPQWPIDLHWLAVGETTAEVLRHALLEPIVPAEESSEGLLKLPVLQQLQQGDRLLVWRGEGGRNLVRDNLQKQGVRVDYLNLYQRQLPANSHHQWLLLRAQQLPDVVILTSGEALNHWLTLVGDDAAHIAAVVVSPRLAVLAQNAGLKTCIIAASTRGHDIIEAIGTWQNSLKHDIQ